MLRAVCLLLATYLPLLANEEAVFNPRASGVELVGWNDYDRLSTGQGCSTYGCPSANQSGIVCMLAAAHARPAVV